jgi:pyochelin biosynthesis protein PchC
VTLYIRPLSRPGSSRPRNRAVVVFPHAGGSPRFFHPWVAQLPAGVDLFGVTYPGRDHLLDNAAPETLVDLARDCAPELQPVVGSSSSVVMFGHSMGAYVAFEAIRSLERMGSSATALVVSGAKAPHFDSGEAWHRASDDELVRYTGELDARSRQVLAVPELRHIFLPTIRDDHRLVETYRSQPDPRLSCGIHALYGGRDPRVTESRAQAWADYTRADFHLRRFAGDHFYLTAHAAEIVAYVSGIDGWR